MENIPLPTCAWRVKLLSKELGVLIIWPSKGQIAATMPECFKSFTQECKHQLTARKCSQKHQAHLKFRHCYGVTTNITVLSSILSVLLQIVQFLGYLLLMVVAALMFLLFKTVDFCECLSLTASQVMADRGFKIKTDLISNGQVLSVYSSKCC